jgi:hypothetical protein
MPDEPIQFPGSGPAQKWNDMERMSFIGQYVQCLDLNKKTKDWDVWVRRTCRSFRDGHPVISAPLLIDALDKAMDAVLNPPGKV